MRSTEYTILQQTGGATSKPVSVRCPMSDVVYVSQVKIERKAGPLRVAHLPGEPQPVFFSVHGAIAQHYGLQPSQLTESHAATLDYVVAALGG
ncbi:MAG TPA: hypothetical protein VK473_04050 [Terriglobales bacterium]|nr:hypothetical protein [Terriglobales bacterium]